MCSRNERFYNRRDGVPTFSCPRVFDRSFSFRLAADAERTQRKEIDFLRQALQEETSNRDAAKKEIERLKDSSLVGKLEAELG